MRTNQQVGFVPTTRDLGPIEDTSLSDYSIQVDNGDNEIAIFLDGKLVADFRTRRDPAINTRVPLLMPSHSGLHQVLILGIDWGGAAHYKWTLFFGEGPMLNFSADDRPPGGYGISAVYTFTINRK